MLVDMVVEIPKGSRNKFEMDHESGHIYLDRMLFTATRYPADYGFIPETYADDDDPLDALALVSEATFPGCWITIKPVGLFVMQDQGREDLKILGVPVGDPVWRDAEELSAIPRHLLRELEHFFAIYKDLEGKKIGVEGWQNAPEAYAAIERARRAYQSG
jgi:inorganic pyrophosphatase